MPLHNVHSLLLWTGRYLKVHPHLNEMLLAGSVTSANFPANYPNNHKKTEILKVKEGNVLSIAFTAFEVEYILNQLLLFPNYYGTC